MLTAGAAAVLLSAVLALAVARGVGSPPSGVAQSSLETAPDFELSAFEGGSLRLSDHAAGPVFLYFWASWCLPCTREAPLIERLWPQYRAAGYTFIGVNIQDREQDARDFVRRLGLTFPLVLDGRTGTYLQYGVDGLPQAFFLRPGLAVDARYVGELDEPRLRALLDAPAAR